MITIKEIMEIADKKGSHFFRSSAMNFFHSEIYEDVFSTRLPNVALFITSEKRSFNDFKRVYTVRRFSVETGYVTRVGDFGDYTTLKDAKIGAKHIGMAIESIPPDTPDV